MPNTLNRANNISSTATPAGRGLPHGLGQHQGARLRNQTAASSTVPRASNKPHHAPAGRRRSSCRRPLKKILLAHATLQGERLSARDARDAPKPRAQQLRHMPPARLLSAHGAGGERLTRATRRPRACSLPPRAKAKAEAVPTVSRAQHVVIRGGWWMEMARMTRAEQEQVRGRPSRKRHGDGLNTWLQHGTLARRKALCSVTE